MYLLGKARISVNLLKAGFTKKLLIKLVPIVLLVFVSKAFAANIYAGDTPTIYYDYLPFADAYKTQQAKNAVSAANLLFVQNVKNYNAPRFLPTIRLLNELNADTEKSICALFKLKTAERLDKYYFSLPISFLSTNRLYLRRGMQPLAADLLNADGELKSIGSLFTDNQKTIMLWNHISYGELVDKELKKIPGKNKIVIQGLSSHGTLAKMIERGRTDYAIVFPSEVADFESEEQDFDLLSYRIERIKPISYGHLMCNKNDASKAWLRKANDIILELYNSPEFFKANTFNINPQEQTFVVDAINQIKSEMLKTE